MASKSAWKNKNWLRNKEFSAQNLALQVKKKRKLNIGNIN